MHDIEIASRIESISGNGAKYSVTDERILKDSHGENKYVCYKLSPYGYAIYNIETDSFEEISPYSTSLPYLFDENMVCYYWGPNNYYYLVNNHYVHTQTGQVITEETVVSLVENEVQKEMYEHQIAYQTDDVATCAIDGPIVIPDTSYYTHYITNKRYFTTLLGNDFGYNQNDTCLMVATAILLGYYDVYVNDSFVADLFRSGNGTTESFHQYFIDNTGNAHGCGMQDGMIAINNYLARRPSTGYTAYSVIGDHSLVYVKVASQIKAGFPVMTGMFHSYNDNCPLDHYNITYGYTIEDNNMSGRIAGIYYHVHQGWKYSSENLQTINYAWFADAIYLSNTGG